jgi:hypothetical protein
MKKLTVSVFAATMGVLALTLSAAACQFSFNYSGITAPLGTVGEIGVRVQKDHANCTLPSMDDYQFAWENIQVLGETAWEEIGPDLYEKWFQVSLSETGDGYLMISKDCTKEGYEEAILPITVLDPAEDGIWQQANEGIYPLDAPESGTVESVVGEGVIIEGTLTIDQLAIELPIVPATFDGEVGRVQLFFTRASNDEILPLLIASEGFFLRFDHLVADAT